MVPISYLAYGIHTLMISAVALLLIKRVADMNIYHEARLFVIGFILSFTVIIILVGYNLNPFEEPQCPDNHYCGTEW